MTFENLIRQFVMMYVRVGIVSEGGGNKNEMSIFDSIGSGILNFTLQKIRHNLTTKYYQRQLITTIVSNFRIQMTRRLN